MKELRQLNAVMIDDDCDDMELLTLALKKTGRFENVHCFDNGHDALFFLEDPEHRPDVLIIDVNMPLMHGLDILASIRTNPWLAGLPVLIYSGSVYPADIEHTREAGANGYIVKPAKAEHYDEISLLIATAAEKRAALGAGWLCEAVCG